MAFQFVQILFWLSLATWFGAVLFVAVAAPVIFRTVRESNPILPGVLSVNMEGQHGTLLAGTIVQNLLSHLKIIQAIAAGVLLVAMIAHLFIVNLGGSNGTAAIVRGGLLIAAIGILLFDWLAIAPKVEQYRKEYLDNADEPEIANPAKDNFDAQHARSVTALQALLFCLIGIILFSGSITPAASGRGTPLDANPIQKAD